MAESIMSMQDKVLVGYQGWFTCEGDGEPDHGWLHWFHRPIPSGGRPNTDVWPDVSAYDAAELFAAPGLATADGDPVHLFSSRNPASVRRHWRWMARHGIDGGFLQRFAGQCDPKNTRMRDLRDEIGDRVRDAAEAERRVYAIMYDVSGVPPDKIQAILEHDWRHLLGDKRILDSPSYLRDQGRPVVALWGFGLDGRKHTPDLVRAIAAFFRAATPGGVYLLAGTAGHWRTATSDADRNADLVAVWTDCFDAISPWTVGRYDTEGAADNWARDRLVPDIEYLAKIHADGGRKVDYIPVVLPGGSGFNLSEGKWAMNDIKRNGGRFLWRQLYNARRAGVRTIYGAMWDEYDEGTAFMPIVSRASQLPVHPSFRFVALDIDGHDLPSDWYMRVLGYAANTIHAGRTLPEALPVKELQAEPVPSAAPPPPYSVEDAWQPARAPSASVGSTPPIPITARPEAITSPPPVNRSTRPAPPLVPPRTPSAERRPPPVPPRPHGPGYGPGYRGYVPPPQGYGQGLPPGPPQGYAPPPGPPPPGPPQGYAPPQGYGLAPGQPYGYAPPPGPPPPGPPHGYAPPPAPPQGYVGPQGYAPSPSSPYYASYGPGGRPAGGFLGGR